MSKIALTPNASGSGTFTIASPNSDTDRTLTLPDEAGTVLTSVSTFSQNSGPAFRATKSPSSQSISAGVWTVLQYNSEEFDTDSCFNTSTYSFTPTVAGYYQVNACVQFADAAAQYGLAVAKNGTRITEIAREGQTSISYPSMAISDLVYLNGSTDYINIEGYSSNSTETFYFDRWGIFTASMVRAA